VDAALQSVEEIFSTLLDISRLDAGALKPDITTFPLSDVLHPLEVEFAPLAKSKNISLRVVGSSAWVTTDRRLLRRLLQNLISNAVKYTPEGRVLVGCRRRSGGLTVGVWDTGVGIAPSKQKLIFKEFQRLENGARIAPGLGLGLSIVERIARVLDLPLRMDSIPGRGSSFRVDLAVADAPTHSTPELQTSALPPSALVLTGTHVLCIDNEPAILEGMRLLLQGWNCRVDTTDSLAGALAQIAATGVPDIIIADYHLDRGDGINAVKQIRHTTRRDIPAVLVTADRGTGVRDAAAKNSMSILHKPLRPASLRALMAQFRLSRAAAE
jgi:CheY-like chemotaxis protein